MFWSNDHMLCREVVKLNPFTAKKGSTQRSRMWEKIADVLNVKFQGRQAMGLRPRWDSRQQT